MRVFWILIGILVLIALLAGNIGNSIEVSSLMEINQSFVLDRDITFSGSGIIITSNNISLDCQFHKISGNGTGSGISFSNLNDVTVENCIIERFQNGLEIDNSLMMLNSSLITNNSKGVITRGNSFLITDNNSIKNKIINLENTDQSVQINAINNWWGSNSSSEISGKISGNVVFDPYLSKDPYSDEDEDGVILFLDNCPSDFNPDQSDSDRDGKGNACDVNMFLNVGAFDPLTESPDIPPSLLTTNETGYFIIQFHKNASIQDIESIGGIIGSVPEDSFIINSTSSLLQIREKSFVRFADIMHPAFKFSHDLLEMLRSNESNDPSQNISVVTYVFQNATGVASQIESMGGTALIYNNEIVSAIEVPETRLIDLAFISDIRYIESPIIKVLSNNVARTILKVADPVNIVQNNFGLTGLNQTIAVADSGLDNSIVCTSNADCRIQNPGIIRDFEGRIERIFSLPVTATVWGLAVNNAGADDGPNDLNGHGTHVAGSVLGDGGEAANVGVQRIRGVAYESNMTFQSLEQFVDFTNPAIGDGRKLGGIPLDMQDLFRPAYLFNSKVRIHTNSWGGGTGYSQGTSQIDKFVRDNQDMLILFAASNDGIDKNMDGIVDDDSISTEGMAKNIVTVGASENNRTGLVFNDDTDYTTGGNIIRDYNFNEEYNIGELVRGAPPAAGTAINNITDEDTATGASRGVDDDNDWGDYSITAGIDGDADTPATGDDVQVVATGTGGLNNNQPVILPGANRILDTAAAVGDEFRVLGDINFNRARDKDSDGRAGVDDDGNNGVDEEAIRDGNNDNYPGVRGINEDGDGGISDGIDYNDAEWAAFLRDRTNFDNDDNENGLIDEGAPDVPGDANGDGCPGVCRVDDDGDGRQDYNDNQIVIAIIRQDLGWISHDDDEDGMVDEDTKNTDLDGDGAISRFGDSGSETAGDKNGDADDSYDPERYIDEDKHKNWGTRVSKFPVNPIKDDHEANNIEGVAAFSSRGVNVKPATAHLTRIKPDVVAPGTWILSTRSVDCIEDDLDPDNTETHIECTFSGLPGKRGLPGNPALAPYYMYSSGTSMATPLAAGTASLIRQYFQDIRKVRNPSAALLKASLINGAKDMTGQGCGTAANGDACLPAPNNHEGWGRIDFYNSTFPSGRYTALGYVDETTGILNSDGKIESYLKRFSFNKPISITLVWTDKPQWVPAPGNNIVHDLDLIVKAPSGKEYHGNVFNADGSSRENPANFDVKANNVERIVIRAAEDGLYNISVRSTDLDMGSDQPFALVFSELSGVDSANETSYYYNFTFGDKIYAKAEGLPNNSKVRVVVLAHNNNFRWDNSIQVTDDAGNGINGFKVLNISNVTTTNNGTFPDRTKIWETLGRERDIIEANGMFNILINSSSTGAIWFNNSTDVIDYHKKVGFNISIINSANETNVSYYFPADSKIYAKAAGFPGNATIQVLTVAHRNDINWKDSVLITDSTGAGQSGFKVLNTSVQRTTNNGTLPDNTVVWDTNGKEKDIVESKGEFNFVVNITNSGHPVWFNNKTDVVDYKNKVGFHVYTANSTNRSGIFNDFFRRGDDVYVSGFGFQPGKKVDIYVFWDGNWFNGAVLTGSKRNINNVTIDAQGNLPKTLLMRRTNINDTGVYDIVIDVNQNQKYDRDIDVVDGRLNKPGYLVCSSFSTNVCMVIITSDSTGVPKDLFPKGDDIYSRVAAFAFTAGSYKIYAVNSSSPIDDLDGHVLNDVSSNGPDTISLPANQLVNITTLIWPQGSSPGDYELIVDSDNDGIFNMSMDNFDPDGFGITQEISAPRFALDTEGNVHVVALLRECCTITLPGGSVITNTTLTKVIYGKIPADSDYTIDVDHPEYFNWSNALSISNFTTVYARLTGTRIDPPDIAVDNNNEAHITFGIASSGFEWVIYAKMNKQGQRDVWADATLCDPAQGCVPSSGGIEHNFAGDLVIPACQATSSGKFLCPGNGIDLLTYWWMDYVQANILFPRISIVNGTVPAILTEVDFTYPDTFYLTQIYPSNFIKQNPIILHPLQPPMFLPFAAAGPTQYNGASLQVAVRNMLPGDDDGGSAWPLGGYSPVASRRLGAVIGDVSSVTAGITGSQGRKDGWTYLPIDEYSKGTIPSLLFYNYNLHAENNKIHVVYSRPETYDRSNYLLDMGSKRKLFYQTIDLTGLNLADSANITYNDDPALYASIDDRDELLNINSSIATRYIPVPGSEKKISDDTVNNVLPDLDVDSNGIAHFVWQTIDASTLKGQIKYATSDFLNEIIVAETQVGVSQARASIALDSQDDPFIAWVDKISSVPTSPLNGTIYYSKGNNTAGIVNFASPIEVVNSSEYSPESPFFEFSQIMTNKNSKKDWTDRTYIGWLDYNPFDKQKIIKVKKTVPHLTMLLVIDGYSSDFLMKNLDLMPNLKDILNNNPTINGSAKVPLPENTFSSQANLFTGLQISKHKIHGDHISINGTDYLLFNDPDKINQILTNENIKTIYDYLGESGKSKAVLGNMYQKGVGYNRPDHKLSGIDWINGNANYAGVLNYLNDLKNNDQLTNNDAADLVTVYLLSNDHGISISADDPAYRNSLTDLDNKFGEIAGKLKSQNIFNDTIFVITADHGLSAVLSNRSLEKTDLLDPDGMITEDLYLNGKYAYYYISGASNITSIAPAARVFYNNSYVWNSSKFYGNVEKILVRINNTYSQYSFDGISDSIMPASEIPVNFTSDVSPQIILIARTGTDNQSRNYFQSSHRSMWGMNASDISVPFIITGQGFKLFSPDTGQSGLSIPIEDVGVTASYFVGGQKAENITRTLDGKNAFKPQFRVIVGSPIDLHLYDSQGRHTGPDRFGNLETNIPTSSFRIIEPHGKKEITLLQAPDKYRIEIEGNGKGRFTLWMEKNTDTESFSIEYPRMMITEDSLAQVDMIGSDTTEMQIDFDRDGAFETIQPPVKNILINENIPESRANASLILVPNNSDISIDVSRSTDAIIEARTTNEISGEILEVQKIFDTSLDSMDFFTAGSYLKINFSDSLINNVDNVRLTINYPDHELLPRRLSESSLGMYEKNGSAWIKLNSAQDEELNLISAFINGSGAYIVASSDTVPLISSVEAIPSRTKVPNELIHIRANISDDDAIQSTVVDFLGNRTLLNYDLTKGYYTADITGPSVNGTYEARIIAEDINNNTISKSAFIEFDQVPPIITIISPQNKLHTTNTLELVYSVDEISNQSYILDSVPEKETGNTDPFKSVRVPLENISSGNHTIKVIAVDDLGNRGEKFVEFGIAGQNIKVENIVLEPYYRIGDNVTVSAYVSNTLITPETGIEVDLIENSVPVSSQIINLSGLETKKISFNYLAGAGRKRIGLRAAPLPDEPYVLDNKVEKDILVTNRIPVLFVNDDIKSNNSKALSSLTAAEASKYDYLLWNTYESGEINQELLEKFPLVFWSSNEPGSMSLFEREALTGYLNENGYLLISGKNFGKDKKDFYGEYLGASFVKDASGTLIEGIYRDAIGNGMLVDVTSPGEEINPVNGATASFTYNGGRSAAVKKENNFKTVYFAFDLNEIIDNDTRNAVMERTLKWFNIDVIPPIISDIQPPDGYGLPKDTDRINLTMKTSEIAECRISDSDLPFNEMNIVDYTNSLQHYTPITNLQNDGHYSMFIKCSDNRKNIGKANTTFFVWNRTFLPPVVEPISDITVLEDQDIKIVVNASDPENDTLSYSISDILSLNFPRPFASRFTKIGNTFVYRSTFDDAGTYNLRVTVSDGYGNESQTFKLTVINVNRPPVLSLIGNRSVRENTYFYFDVNATDPDGDELRYSDDTSLFDINPYTGIISFTPKLRQVGVYQVNIGVTDGEFVDSEMITFNVTGINHPPVLDFIPPQFARVGMLFNLTLSAYDADGETLTFSDNSTLFDISSTGEITFTPTISDIGTHYIEIRVSDGKVGNSKMFNLVVTSTNTPPRILNITQNMSVRRGQVVEIGVEACDPDIPGSCP